jgi:hypothetical protein
LARIANPRQRGKAVANGVSLFAFNKVGSKLKSLENVGKIAKSESRLLQFITDVHDKLTSFVINFISNKK